VAVRTLLAVALCFSPGLALADGGAPPIPNTPAGSALASWLDAFNSGDRARLESFNKSHAPWATLDREMKLLASTGGYDLLSIDKSEKLWISFRLKQRATATQVIGSVVVKSNNPALISLLSLTPADAKADEVVLDSAERSRVVDRAAKLIDQVYVFPDVAKTTATRLRAQEKRGAFQGITDGKVFAARLEDEVRALSDDKHFAVDYFSQAMPPDEPTARPHPDPRQLAADHCGFEKAEHYSPNIGYLKLDAFEEPEFCSMTAIAGMNFLADSDALIIDLRDNHGGAPHMVALICSYLFPESTHLDDIYDRKQNTTEQLWTFPYLQGKKFTGTVYVLTSRRTFSAAEEFSYDLKSLKRATLIGETTGGGAHTVAPQRIDENFYIQVPFGRFINPVTKTDWEGSGVEPDIKVAAADALDEALKRARGGP
jgi:Peptidase family S41/N-terminal domain of Peptidase_S41 in eukaryotic IRBP